MSSPLTDFLRKAQSYTASIYPAGDQLTLAGVALVNAAVSLGKVSVEVAGEGWISRRSISISFDKDQWNGTPASGSTLIHEGIKYTVNDVSGSEPWSPTWKLTGVEFDRK